MTQADPPGDRPRRRIARDLDRQDGLMPTRPIRETMPLDEARSAARSTRRCRSSAPSASRSATPTAACCRSRSRRAVDVPPFDRAAMDGYAVIAEDTFGASAQRAEDACAASTASSPARSPTHAVTRGDVHRDRDRRAAARRRRRRRDGRRNRARRRRRSGSLTPVYPKQHVGRRGADIAAGQAVLRAGQPAEPEPHRRAGGDRASRDVEVFARPRVAILSTGNEIVEPGQPLGPARSTTSTASRCASIVGAHGGEPMRLPDRAGRPRRR